MSYQVPTRIRNALMGEFAPLSEIIDSAVEQSFRTADLECRGTPGEVDKVLSFFIEGLELIENEFNRVLAARRIHVRISGIFTHQTPMVELQTPPPKRVCELADLCILATYGRALGRNGLGNALFLQAKNDFDSDASPVQRALYEVETDFHYNRPNSLVRACPSPPPLRHLPPKGEPALAYWELDEWVWRHPRYGVRDVTGLLWANQVNRRHPQRHGFGAAMMDFFRGAAGYGFRTPGRTSRNWSRIIFDLVTLTTQAAVNRANLNVRGVPRGIGDLVRLLNREYANRPDRPYALRNSLGEILTFYSQDLGLIGRKLEEAAKQNPWQQELDSRGVDNGGDYGGGISGEPPILGNERRVIDGDDGVGNLIFVHFSEQQH